MVARTLCCSCAVCCPRCLGYVHDTAKKVEKKKSCKKNRHDVCEDRTRAFKFKIGHRDQFTIFPKTHTKSYYYYFSRRTRHTGHTCTAAAQHKRERWWCPMTGRSATSIAVHHGPATHAWCGQLPRVLLGGDVTCTCLFVLFACCQMSRSLRCASGKNTKRREYKDSWRTHI